LRFYVSLYAQANRRSPNWMMKTLNTSNSTTQNQDCGTLYVVSTPIGNLEDITLRALRILKAVHVIAAENVAHSRGLCRHYGIKTLVVSYHQHNKKVKGPELVKRLKSGLDIALVTDAGTPGISDPGAYLVRMAADEGIKITPVPGPSAVMAALSVSGFPTDNFVFLGFLSNRSGKRKNELSKLAAESRTMIFFESPHRVRAMLMDLREVLGDRQIVMLREMTKVFEEAKRGPVSVVLAHLMRSRIRGEFTLVVPGTQETIAHGFTEDLYTRIEELLADEEMTVRDIADLISREEGLAYRTIYKECLARKKEIERFEMNGLG